MSNQRMGMKIASLERQQEFLKALQSRHLGWAGDTKDKVTKTKHLEIANRLGQIREEYTALITIYQGSPERPDSA